MPPARTDYEVRTLAGRLLFTSDSAEIAWRWADGHCLPETALAVNRVVVSRHCILTVDRREHAA